MLLNILLINFYSLNSYGESYLKDCAQNAVYCQIIKNNPKIDQGYALELATLINQVAVEYNLKPYRLAAIIAQESGYKLNAVNTKSKDYGIAQINQKTIKAFEFDQHRLLTDLRYSIEAGAIVLSDFKRRYGHREKDYWTRFNSSIPEKREEYKQLVLRYF